MRAPWAYSRVCSCLAKAAIRSCADTGLADRKNWSRTSRRRRTGRAAGRAADALYAGAGQGTEADRREETGKDKGRQAMVQHSGWRTLVGKGRPPGEVSLPPCDVLQHRDPGVLRQAAGRIVPGRKVQKRPPFIPRERRTKGGGGTLGGVNYLKAFSKLGTTCFLRLMTPSSHTWVPSGALPKAFSTMAGSSEAMSMSEPSFMMSVRSRNTL